jgi:hypothetical protein
MNNKYIREIYGVGRNIVVLLCPFTLDANFMVAYKKSFLCSPREAKEPNVRKLKKRTSARVTAPELYVSSLPIQFQS